MLRSLRQRQSLRGGALLLVAVIVGSACSSAVATPAATPTSAPQTAAVTSQPTASGPTATATLDPAKYNFALIYPIVNPFYDPFPGAVADAAKALGIPVPDTTGPQAFDQSAQNQIVDTYVAKGVTGLGIQPVDDVGGNATISRLVGQGIKVVGFANCPKVVDGGAAYCLEADLGAAAYDATIDLIKAMGGKGNIVHISPPADQSTGPSRIAGVEKAVAENPGVKLIQTISDPTTDQQALDALTALLAAKGSQIDGIIATSSFGSNAVSTLFEQRKETRIKAIVTDNNPVVDKATIDGYITANMQANRYADAYISVYSLKLMVDGCTWKTGVNPIVIVPYVYIDKTIAPTSADYFTKQTATLITNWKDNWTCPTGEQFLP